MGSGLPLPVSSSPSPASRLRSGPGSTWEKTGAGCPPSGRIARSPGTGPYRFVRHPIYSGILLGLLGTAIGIGYFIVFCCVLLILVLFVIKFRIEEKFLEEEFGEEYAKYKREVKALIPYVI